tara:strand:+ start:2585 stop:2857 length:273 start_codon:yes stop_codon:yes gene_type:complete
MINIKKIDKDNFVVLIKKNTETVHRVFFPDEFYLKFKTNKSKENILEMSFEFLLKRESNTMIFTKFNLEEINNYFPEYFKTFNITSKNES